MYYLNDKHAKYEYAIYKIVNNGYPYIANTFSNLRQLEECLNSLERWHNGHHQTYYIDAKGYKNEYEKDFVQFYYKILQREINDWQEIA